VTIPRFSLAHDRFQSADSPKYLSFSTRQFELPPDRPATFAVDLAVENIGGEPGDYRQGMAAFHVFDLDVSKRVFAVCGTSTRVLVLHEQLGLGGGGAGEPFYHVVESPYEDFDDDFTRLRACEVTLDPEQLDRGLARRRPHCLRGPPHPDPRTHSHRVRDLDDAADLGRSQPLARHERPLAPVPCTRGRRVSRHERRTAVITGAALGELRSFSTCSRRWLSGSHNRPLRALAALSLPQVASASVVEADASAADGGKSTASVSEHARLASIHR
jgi:hypothetical protein